ncbi:MAG: excinuclease ABC subunit UvrA [bacterium]
MAKLQMNKIIIKGAREHNLKSIDLELPRDKLIVITGLSGSGKSSLAFDTIYAEGQRRYVESLSAYARQFLGQMEKPDVDYIEGLSPAISIEQRSASKNPRSTVGTVTEIYDYLRLLFARIGIPHCYNCGRRISKQSPDEIVEAVEKLGTGARIQILAPLVRGRKGEYQHLLTKARKEGYVRIRVDGETKNLDEDIPLDKNKRHTLEVVVDRLVIKEGIRTRLADSIETALKLANGIVVIDRVGEGECLFSEHLACPECEISYEELAPRMFSFNSPYGACPQCNGLGTKLEIDPERVITDPHKPIYEGIVQSFGLGSFMHHTMMEGVANYYGFSLDTPFSKLSEEHQRLLLYGTGRETIEFTFVGEKSEFKTRQAYEGVITNLRRRYKETNSEYIRGQIEALMSRRPCPECGGARLKKESLAVRVVDKSIAEITSFSVSAALDFFEHISLNERERLIAGQVLKEVKTRLGFLRDVGLDYLTLDRQASTLSGGEAQRIRLATQVGSGLVGVLYVLDEPSIGLHQRDNRRLLNTLLRLRDLGNTLIVVEHDEETIRQADFVVDLGPGAGERGGEVVAAGPLEMIIHTPESLTGQYLTGKLEIPIPRKRAKPKGKFLTIKGARVNNLKDIEVRIPLGLFTCITGVSGSGKSSLIEETLYPTLANYFYPTANYRPGTYDKITGLEYLDKVIDIDQSPIGRTPRSNPATYTGTFTPIRDLFAQLPESKIRGYKPGRFSFNVKGGRCEACSGDGIIKIEMHFLPDVYIPCEVCKGKRYNQETLEAKYKGKNISDCLEMTVTEAEQFFANIPMIKRKLSTLADVGLGYIKLGQPATTLSGGEAQRVKLSTELAKRATGRTLYLLDEPTTGLHFDDIKKLLGVLLRLRDAGNTVVVIEHNLDVIKTADYIIDLGPEGGEEGGRVVAVGSPEKVSQVEASYTGRFLCRALHLE